MKTRIALMFGGKSVEHEVSVISALQAYMALDEDKYEVIPVYMTKDNDMYIGEDIGDIRAYRNIPELIKASEMVILCYEDGRFLLTPCSAKKQGIFTASKKAVEIDMAFPVVHGTNVEDGALQGYLKTIGIPFIGPDVTASAVSMDKFVTKAILRQFDIPVLDSKFYTLSHYIDVEKMASDIEASFGYPVIIKPVNLGSSVGISIANNFNELINSIDDAFRYATKIMAEHAISNLREINCSVLGDENHAIASECEEPLHTKDILSYEDKYVNNAGGKGGKSGKASGSSVAKGAGMASVARKIPADLSHEKREEVRELAIRSFQALGCNGVSRIDFMIDEDNGKLYFNEINPIPGSLSFYLWEPIGVSYTELLDRMIELALKRQRQEAAVTFSFDTNILANANLGGSKGRKN